MPYIWTVDFYTLFEAPPHPLRCTKVPSVSHLMGLLYTFRGGVGGKGAGTGFFGGDSKEIARDASSSKTVVTIDL